MNIDKYLWRLMRRATNICGCRCEHGQTLTEVETEIDEDLLVSVRKSAKRWERPLELQSALTLVPSAPLTAPQSVLPSAWLSALPLARLSALPSVLQ